MGDLNLANHYTACPLSFSFFDVSLSLSLSTLSNRLYIMSHAHSHGQMQTIQIADWKKAPPFMKSTAEYLMDGKKSGLKLRQGVFNGKRVDYFKGKGAAKSGRKDKGKDRC